MKSHLLKKGALLLLAMLYSLQLFAQYDTGTLWLLNPYPITYTGKQFTSYICYTPGTQTTGAMRMELFYPADMLKTLSVYECDSGNVTATFSEPGIIKLALFNTAGLPSKPYLKIAAINWQVLVEGTAALKLTSDDYPPIGINSANNYLTILKRSLLYGDVNNDGVVNIVDALVVAQIPVGLVPIGFSTEHADVNGDRNINIIDALMIAQYSVGIITEFPVTKKSIQTTDLTLNMDSPFPTFDWLNGITLTLKDRAGRPLAGKTITFNKTSNSFWSIVSPIETRTDGIAFSKVTMPIDSGQDDYVLITATFDGDTIYSPATCQFYAHMYSPPHPTMPPTPRVTPTSTP